MLTERAFDTPHCVGRDAELDLVRALVHEAALGNGAALVWLGERGIGKSRLLQECARLPLAATVLGVRCGGAAIFALDLCAQIAAALRMPRGARARSTPAILSELVMRAKRRPVAILIDDLHLADPGERNFIDALLARTLHHRIVVVACANHGRPATAIVRELAPLDDAAMEVLVRGSSGARGLSDDHDRAIIATSQGNPRVALELVQHVRSGNATPLVAQSAREIVAAARRSLSPSEFDVLSTCSVVGETFECDWLPEIAQRSRTEVADALQHASELGLLESVVGHPGRLAFRQIVVRNALLASIVALKRQILHERVVERLARERSSDAIRADTDLDVLLGDHAEVIENREVAAEAFSRAAAHMSEAAAFGPAAQLYVRAAAQVAESDARWLPLLRQAIRCYRNVGDWKRVQGVAESLLERLAFTENAEAAGAALEDLFYAHLNDGNREAAARTAERIAAVGLPNSATRGNVATLILAYGLCYSGMISQAKSLVATVAPERLRDDEVRLRYLVANAEIEALVTPLDLTLRRIDEAAAIAQTLGVRGTVLTYGAGAEIACRFGNLEKAREYVRHAERAAMKSAGAINDVRRLAVIGWTRIAMLSGDLPAARELIASNVGWRASGRHNESFDSGVAVTVGMRVGDLALVEAFFDPQLLYDSVASREAEACGLLLPGFAEVMLVRGMVKELRSVVEQCVEKELIDPYTSIQLAATRFASLQCAATAMEQVRGYFKDAIAPAASGHVALAQATLLRRQGKHIAATERAAAAAARFRELGWCLYEAIALDLAGNVRAASRAFGQCGARSDVARLAAGETRKLKYAPFGARLSPRELEVARLVAANRSNRDIALALDISVRTVDHHVEAAFSKLGIHNRWQLDASMLERR